MEDILAVDVSGKMLEANLAENGARGSSLGNDPGLRTWHGDVQSVPPYQVCHCSLVMIMKLLKFSSPPPRRRLTPIVFIET